MTVGMKPGGRSVTACGGGGRPTQHNAAWRVVWLGSCAYRTRGGTREGHGEGRTGWPAGRSGGGWGGLGCRQRRWAPRGGRRAGGGVCAEMAARLAAGAIQRAAQGLHPAVTLTPPPPPHSQSWPPRQCEAFALVVNHSAAAPPPAPPTVATPAPRARHPLPAPRPRTPAPPVPRLHLRRVVLPNGPRRQPAICPEGHQLVCQHQQLQHRARVAAAVHAGPDRRVGVGGGLGGVGDGRG